MYLTAFDWLLGPRLSRNSSTAISAGNGPFWHKTSHKAEKNS